MPVENAFTLGLSYIRKETSAQTVPQEKNARWREEKWEWAILTNSTELKEKVLSEIAHAKPNDPAYGPKARHFGDQTVEMVNIPYSLMKEISKGSCDDFIIFNRISKSQPWSISKTYTRGDLSAYFGARFQGTYQTTGKKRPPKPVR